MLSRYFLQVVILKRSEGISSIACETWVFGWLVLALRGDTAEASQEGDGQLLGSAALG